MTLYKRLSSANNFSCHDISSPMSLMYTRKQSGPRTVPWGTPDLIIDISLEGPLLSPVTSQASTQASVCPGYHNDRVLEVIACVRRCRKLWKSPVLYIGQFDLWSIDCVRCSIWCWLIGSCMISVVWSRVGNRQECYDFSMCDIVCRNMTYSKVLHGRDVIETGG